MDYHAYYSLYNNHKHYGIYYNHEMPQQTLTYYKHKTFMLATVVSSHGQSGIYQTALRMFDIKRKWIAIRW
jgi:hypothetical protein